MGQRHNESFFTQILANSETVIAGAHRENSSTRGQLWGEVSEHSVLLLIDNLGT